MTPASRRSGRPSTPQRGDSRPGRCLSALRLSGRSRFRGVPHCPPERRLCIRDPRVQFVPAALDGPTKVEVGELGIGTVLTRVGNIPEDAREPSQAIAPALKGVGRCVQLARAHVGERGERLGEVPVDRIARQSSTPRRSSRFAGTSSALASSARTLRSSRASLPFA
jgi:hypothetical protein